MIRTLFILLLLLHSLLGFAEQQRLVIYNWGEYLPSYLLKQFERESGIKVQYATYDSNEVMFAKLRATPYAGYDVVFPSTYFLERMIKQDMLLPLDYQRLPHAKALKPALLALESAPAKRFSVPYVFGVLGVAINDKYIAPDSVKHWQDLWGKRFRRQLLLIDDVRNVFGMALSAEGLSINTRDPAQLQQAFAKLLHLLPNVKVFDINLIQPTLIDEDLRIAVITSGDTYLVQLDNPAVKFVIPQEPAIVTMDNMVIPKQAPHLDNAYKFIDFLLRPEISAQLSQRLGFMSPIQGAARYFSRTEQRNPLLNIKINTLHKPELQSDVGLDASRQYQDYWVKLKLSA